MIKVSLPRAQSSLGAGTNLFSIVSLASSLVLGSKLALYFLKNKQLFPLLLETQQHQSSSQGTERQGCGKRSLTLSSLEAVGVFSHSCSSGSGKRSLGSSGDGVFLLHVISHLYLSSRNWTHSNSLVTGVKGRAVKPVHVYRAAFDSMMSNTLGVWSKGSWQHLHLSERCQLSVWHAQGFHSPLGVGGFSGPCLRTKTTWEWKNF